MCPNVLTIILYAQYIIFKYCIRSFVSGDVEDCVVEDLNQGQFTPLSEALCLVILELTSANQNATIDTVRSALKIFFSNIQPPAEHIIYDAMVNLMSDNKVSTLYQQIC